jgi:transcriptional regulator with XRE-family HTH domain
VKKHSEKKYFKQIGIRIRQERIKQGISQNQLAFEASMPRVQIGRIERGEINTSVGSIIGICRVLNIHLKDLFDFEIS